MIRTTYLDRICYRSGVMIASAVSGQDMLSSGCDDRECRVRIGYVIVRVCDVRKRHVPAWGIRMELHPKFCPADIPPYPNISHPDGRGGRFNFPGQTCSDPLIGYFTFGYLTSGWERTFQLPWSDMFGSSDRIFHIQISHSRMEEEDVSTSPVRHVRIL